MKLTVNGREPKAFEPVDICIKLETQEELDAFTRLTVGYDGLSLYRVPSAEKTRVELCTELHRALRALGGRA